MAVFSVFAFAETSAPQIDSAFVAAAASEGVENAGPAVSIDSAVASLDTAALAVTAADVVQDSLAVMNLQSATTLEKDSLSTDSQKTTQLKTVLYLSGGERSPWFHLGVLYAIEEYGIPVDSVVGTSWGAWVGALWAKGVALDEIQRLLMDPYIVSYAGHDLSDPQNRIGVEARDAYEIPLSEEGVPSLRQRFTLTADSSGSISRNKKPLRVDSLSLKRSLAKLRFQEVLYRQKIAYDIPFSVQACGGKESGNRPADVIASLPLWIENESESSVNGELCPHFAVPVEDNVVEFPIVVVADPLRSVPTGDSRSKLLKEMAGVSVRNLPGATIRAHSAVDTSRSAMIQLGFSTLERYLADFSPLGTRRVSYANVFKNRDVRKSWFRFNPSFDSLSAETHRAVKTYWTDSDTGFVALENFADKLLKNPAYDSLSFEMQPSGDLLVSAAVHPTFDVAVGGFGSNVIGANAYFEGSVNYVSQMEISLTLAGFYGMSSYGVQPRLNVSKLWSKNWGLQFVFDYLKLRPLKSFNNEIASYLRIDSEERSDFSMSVIYDVDEHQTFSANFLFGHREYVMPGSKTVNVNPVAPTLNYTYSDGETRAWFAQNGLVVNASAGLESIGYDDGLNDIVPIYWKFFGNAQYAISPKPFVTLMAGVAGGIERYRGVGGYVSPKSIGHAPLDVAYRFQVQATPWSTEWYNAELASHEYGLLRASAGLHKGPVGLWLFTAYFHDFEGSPYAELSRNKFVVEPALRLDYKSFELYAGMNRIVDVSTAADLLKFRDYTYFIRVGTYRF